MEQYGRYGWFAGRQAQPIRRRSTYAISDSMAWKGPGRKCQYNIDHICSGLGYRHWRPSQGSLTTRTCLQVRTFRISGKAPKGPARIRGFGLEGEERRSYGKGTGRCIGRSKRSPFTTCRITRQKMSNVSDKHPEIVEKLMIKLKEWGRTLPNKDGSKAVVITPAVIPESI